MYKYETHLHTAPVSKCAKVGVRETLEFYKQLGYDGVFLTNHFLDGNINIDPALPYEEKINFYFSDYEQGVEIGKELGLKVFLGVELTYGGTDFLVYGLDKAWFLAHPEIMDMPKSTELAFLKEQGALVIQAHPFRLAAYIDHIRIFPEQIHGVEVINACRDPKDNKMAELFAENYGFIKFAGTDNHAGPARKELAGMCANEPVVDEKDFVQKVLSGQMELFHEKVPESGNQ